MAKQELLDGNLQSRVSKELTKYLKSNNNMSVRALRDKLLIDGIRLSEPAIGSIKAGTENPGVVNVDKIGKWIKLQKQKHLEEKKK